MVYKLKYFIFLLLAIMISGCSYSFTGASIPNHIKTIAVPTFMDNSGKGESNLATRFTYQTIQEFIDDNNLQIVDKKYSDAIINCTISRFTELPATIAGNETVNNMRITIAVKVEYRDLVEKKKIFEQTFSNYADYDNTSSDFQTARTSAINEVIEKVSEDIVLGVVANW